LWDVGPLLIAELLREVVVVDVGGGGVDGMSLQWL